MNDDVRFMNKVAVLRGEPEEKPARKDKPPSAKDDAS